jgi:hypothetical protein
MKTQCIAKTELERLREMVAAVKAAAVQAMSDLVEEIGWLGDEYASEVAESARDYLEAALTRLAEEPSVTEPVGCSGHCGGAAGPSPTPPPCGAAAARKLASRIL